MPRDMKTKMAQFDLQRLPECPFKIEVRSACKELPSEGTYELISTEKGEDGIVTMVLELEAVMMGLGADIPVGGLHA